MQRLLVRWLLQRLLELKASETRGWRQTGRIATVERRLLEAVPAPAGYRQVGRHAGLGGRIRKDFARRPLHVRAQGVSEIRVIRKFGVVSGLHEASDEARAVVVIGALSGMDLEHSGMTAMRPRIARWTAEDLSTVISQILDVLGVNAVRERMVQLRVLETALVMRRGEREKRGIAAREVIDRWTGHGHSLAQKEPPLPQGARAA